MEQADRSTNNGGVWVSTGRIKHPIAIAALGALVLVVTPGVGRLAGLPLIAAALILSRVRVTVDRNGLTTSLGGIFRRRIPLAEMDGAEAVELHPSEWGGWGYRMAPGRTALVLRRGDAIAIRLKDGNNFSVSVDHAATGAGLLNGLLDNAHLR